MFSLFGQLLPCPTSPSLLRNATSPSRGGLGIAGSSSSSPEAPLLGELSNEVRLRGCTKTGLPSVARPALLRHIAPQASSSELPGLPRALLLGATTTTAASGGSRESLLGPRPARRKRSAADAGCRNPGSGTEGDGEGKPFTIKPLHSDKQTFCQSDTIVALPILCQHPCPLRRSAPALPKGEPFIWKKRQTRICLFFHALIALLSPSFSA